MSKIVKVSIPDGLYQELSEMAEDEGHSVSGLARDFIVTHIRNIRHLYANAKAADCLDSMVDMMNREMSGSVGGGLVAPPQRNRSVTSAPQKHPSKKAKKGVKRP